MTHNICRNLLLGAAFGALALPAAAATVTFDALGDEGDYYASGGAPYVEDGVSVTGLGGAHAHRFAPGAAHLTDSGTGFAYGLKLVMEAPFDALSFTTVSGGYSFRSIPDLFVDNIFVTGFVGETAVASASFLLSAVVGEVQTFTLGEAFLGLTALTIATQHPGYDRCGAPCGQLDLDTVELASSAPAPVPLPAAGLLLGGAALLLAGAGAARRLKRG